MKLTNIIKTNRSNPFRSQNRNGLRTRKLFLDIENIKHIVYIKRKSLIGKEKAR